MSSIVPFDFETNAVRVVMQDNEPWFVVADVCRVLEHSNPRKAVARLDDDEVQVMNLNTVTTGYGIRSQSAGNPNANIVSESGLYALIITSRVPAAKRFRKWVTAEVLPTLRRDGSYSLTDDGLAVKRSRFQGLPEKAREIAAERAEALRLVNEAIEHGMKMKEALALVAAEFEVAPSTIASWRRTVYMVAQRDIEAALAPKWFGPRGMFADCHPEALQFFTRQYNHPARPTLAECHRRTIRAAEENGWGAVPCVKTMTRNMRSGLEIAALEREGVDVAHRGRRIN